MFGAKTINRHAALMNRMAETVGVDLTAAIADGRLPAEAWREAVVRCTGCSDPEGCQHWLGAHAADDVAPDTAPDYCRNRDLMDSLRTALTD